MSRIRIGSYMPPANHSQIPAAEEEEEKKESTRPAAQEEQTLDLANLSATDAAASTQISFMPPKLFSNPEPEKIEENPYLSDYKKRKLLLILLQKNQNEIRQYTTASNVLKSKHDAIKSSINNMR